MYDDKILVNKENLEKMETKLVSLKLLVEDESLKKNISEILEIIDSEINGKTISIKQCIREKMDETKFSNPELNFKLYMLYRKLSDGKIDEEEALKAYEIYINM